MKKVKLVADAKLSIVDYVTLVNEIVWSYFDIEGNYQPQIGIINVMRLFYNMCVKQSRFDKEHPHNVIDAMDIEEVFKDEEFIREFNNAICVSDYSLDFANAYRNAMDVIENKKSSVGSIISEIERGLKKLAESINPILSNGNIDRLAEVFKDASNGDIPVDNIIYAYKKSNANKEALSHVGEDVDKD